MSIVRTALPLVLLTSVLTGCAGLQKTDWPTCAAVGGGAGGALGNAYGDDDRDYRDRDRRYYRDGHRHPGKGHYKNKWHKHHR